MSPPVTTKRVHDGNCDLERLDVHFGGGDRDVAPEVVQIPCRRMPLGYAQDAVRCSLQHLANAQKGGEVRLAHARHIVGIARLAQPEPAGHLGVRQLQSARPRAQSLAHPVHAGLSDAGARGRQRLIVVANTMRV